MQRLSQSPTDPAFVQDPYPFYDRARAMGPLVWWEEYGMVAAFGQAQVHALLRDRRFGRERPAEMPREAPAHLAPWLQTEAHSMLDAEPPRHTRLRGLVLRAFTSRKIAAMEADIVALCHDLVDRFPEGAFDLLPAYCTAVPVTVICRLLGVPEEDADQLLDWSHRMVAMYQASRTRETEDSAAAASAAFTAYLKDYIDRRRAAPGDDLITRLIAAEEDGTRLTTDELIGTCILLLNAGHEATVHGLGNGVKTMLGLGLQAAWMEGESIAATVEEILRYDPPLHMFTRYAYEDLEVFGHGFRRGDQVALMLGAANRDPAVWPDPHRFDPERAQAAHTSLGGGLHFCVGAPLARLEMQIALPILFERCPGLRLAAPPVYADSYHFHGLTRLMVAR
ncbi:MAG: cytochrome P450 [Rhodobacteraceae bacterium]|nr:cytochrome P450 [Paracoccaceae bacterium]